MTGNNSLLKHCFYEPSIIPANFQQNPTSPNQPMLEAKEKTLCYTIGTGYILGRGGNSIVFRAEDLKSGQIVALKKSRVPLRVKRPVLQHEGRVLQILQGHPAIPELYGYGHLVHFEYISMEVLGPSVREKAANGSLLVISVIRIVEQALSALKHVHKHGLVHRDIKPDNFLCSINDVSKIMLIDFGLAKPMNPGPPRTYDPIKEKKSIVGTLHWASLNSHRGIDLGPGDDLESLAYTALFLLRGKLPWQDYQRCNRGSFVRSQLRLQSRTHRSKATISSSQLAMHFPSDFSYLLDYSRRLSYHQVPDYDELEGRFFRLAESLGGYEKSDPLDWTCIPAVAAAEELSVSDENNFDEAEEDVEDGEDGEEVQSTSEVHIPSYDGDDFDLWDDVNSSRDVSLTLPTKVEELADNHIPTIIEAHGYCL